MGAYLSEPETKKISSDEAGKNVAFGASSMQGWRVNQEDAHNCCINFDENVSLFAVYDGHGGHEVATYCSQKLPEFIKNTDAYKNGDIEKALIDAFLGFDATLADPEIVLTLKKIAGTAVTDKEQVDSCDSSEEDTITNLRKEAEMPLEQVMLKYQTESMGSVKSNKIISSPFIRCRRAKAGCSSSSASSSGAGCSSSWNTNEGDVSSSSSSATPATSEEKKEDSKKPDLPGSSDSDQVLDSTSNGDGPHTSTTNAPDATKISQLPDSSEDVDDNSSNKISSNSEVNGEKEKKNAVNAGPDSSKNDNVSSSCSSLGNGDAGQQEGISSSSKKNQNENIYKNLLQKAIDNSDDESDSDDDDDDDENDETFCSGEPEGSDEDEDEELEEEEEEDYSELDDDDDDDDDDDEEIDDEDGEPILTDEPGVDSGCTAVVAVLKGTELYVANAGDSRCVLCRDGEAIELSLDHKPEDEPEMTRIVKAGGKVTSDGRVNGGLNLSRALGDHAYKQNTALPPAEQMISALPDIKKITIDPKRDEFMILACDGIWNFMSSGEVVKYVRERLKKHESLSKICEELFDHCLAPDTLGDGTGCDNMTAVIVKFNETLGQEVKNNGAAEGMSVARKRAMSPTEEEKNSDENSGEAVKNDLPIEECKRAKMEAV